MAVPPPDGEGPGALRRFILPALFVAALFATVWMRRPAPLAPSADGPEAAALAQGQAYRFTGPTMGTTFNVTVVGALDPAAQARARDAVSGALQAVNAEMSTYQADSALSRFNRHASTAPFPASPALRAVMSEARRVSALSGGAFDVTVGPLVRAWGFGPDAPGAAPDGPTLEALRARVGWQRVVVEADALRKTHPDVEADLSAIAKGYGVDRAAMALDALGHARYLVEVGGEVRARGVNAGGAPWRVGVEKPESGGARAVREVVSLRDLSMATSGDYRSYREVDGKRLSHTVDPRTGRPIEHRLASVSVLHRDCMTADALATALNVLGPEAGMALADAQGLAVLMLVRGDSGFEERSTAAWKTMRAQSR